MNAIEIRIRPDPRLLPSVLSAISSYAKLFFKNEKDIDHIVLATEEAVGNVLSFSVTPHLDTVTVTADAASGEFTVCVLDHGLPGDYEKTLSGEDRLGLMLMHNAVDVATVENLGTAGRCQRLIKYYSTVADFSALPELPKAAPIENAQITVRSPKKAEMLDVCRALYNEYGMTYSNDIVYYPDRFYAAVAKDQIHSTVAVDENGNLAGHHAVFQWSTIPGVWEGGMAVVNGNYRNAGVFRRMMQRSFDYVRNEVNGKLFIGCCVMTHPYSQKNRLKYGGMPCGFLLNLTPPDVLRSSFKTKDCFTADAIAASVFDTTPKTVYLPEEAAAVAEKIYGWLGLPRTVVTDLSTLPETGVTESAWYFNSAKRNGTINLRHPRSDFLRNLRNHMYELKLRGAEMMVLYVPIEQSGFPIVYEAAKAEGFFFTGILPATDQGDVIMMQKMLNNVVDYDSLIAYGPFAELLNDIRAFDPDNK